MSEKIYILTNPAMPDLVKIGMTSWELKIRIEHLSRATGVPLPFEVFYAAEVANMKECEKLIHDVFIDKRLNPKREFFRVAPEQVVSAIKLAELKNITPNEDIVDSQEEQEALNRARRIREVFKFNLVNIPIWSVLYYKDNETITCTVFDDRRVLYNWEISYLTPITMKIIHSEGKFWKAVQWPSRWIYEWETLTERRLRYEE
jgi:hypothetical protein